MATSKIVYASLTGNTEEAADFLGEALNDAGVDTEVIAIDDTSVEDLKDTDIVIVATYTYGNGDLPDEALDFFEGLQDTDLSGKVYGVIGTGDTMYDLFCKSADDFAEALDAAGATKGAEIVKIENEPDIDDKERLTAFAAAIVAAV